MESASIAQELADMLARSSQLPEEVAKLGTQLLDRWAAVSRQNQVLQRKPKGGARRTLPSLRPPRRALRHALPSGVLQVFATKFG